MIKPVYVLLLSGICDMDMIWGYNQHPFSRCFTNFPLGMFSDMWLCHYYFPFPSRTSWFYFHFPQSFTLAYILFSHEKSSGGDLSIFSLLLSSLLQYKGLLYNLGETRVHIASCPWSSVVPRSCQVGTKKKNSFYFVHESLSLWEVASALIRASWLVILSPKLRKSNQKYFPGAATRLVTLHLTLQSNGAP